MRMRPGPNAWILLLALSLGAAAGAYFALGLLQHNPQQEFFCYRADRVLFFGPEHGDCYGVRLFGLSPDFFAYVLGLFALTAGVVAGVGFLGRAGWRLSERGLD